MNLRGKNRCEEITEYLKEHPEVQSFVIIDDYYETEFMEMYPKQFVLCDYYTKASFDEECYLKALGILKM